MWNILKGETPWIWNQPSMVQYMQNNIIQDLV